MKEERKQFLPMSLKATMDAGRRRQTALKKISVSDSQLVGKKNDVSVTTGQEGHGISSASVTAFLLDMEAVDHLPGGLPLAQSSFIFVPICHHPPPPPLRAMSANSSPLYLLSLLSAAVKSDRLQVCFLSEGRFTAAVCPQTPLYDIAPLPIYWAVIDL